MTIKPRMKTLWGTKRKALQLYNNSHDVTKTRSLADHISPLLLMSPPPPNLNVQDQGYLMILCGLRANWHVLRASSANSEG